MPRVNRAAEPHRAAALGADRRLALAGIEPAVDLADDLEPLLHGARDREAVGQHVVLVIAARRVAEDAETDVADEADRLDGLADAAPAT